MGFSVDGDKESPKAERPGSDHPVGLQNLQPVAEFQGSLVRNQIGSIPKCSGIPKDKRSVRQWVYYVRLGWGDIHIWKSAFVEFMATTFLCATSGLIDTTIGNTKAPASVPAYVGISNTVLLSIFIMATAPGSGGHINPLITFATMITGLTPFSRGILYMLAQTLGAGVAGGVLRGVFGKARALQFQGGGCVRDSNTVLASQALLLEAFSSLVLLFLAFGVALDPRQQKLFGPLAGPLAVGVALGLISFAGSGLVPGYTGASMNPTRCFAFAVARSNFYDQWIWWVGPVIGAVLHATGYHIAPPYHGSSMPGL